MSDIELESVDFLVIGSGPGGQKAAICAAKAGKRVALIERERHAGGACVHQGTIPSKTLRENAIRLSRLRGVAHLLDAEVRENVEMAQLMGRLGDVISRNAQTIGAQLERNGIERVHGQARFVSDHAVEVVAPDGSRRSLEATTLVVATGSRPRLPDDIPVDHEHILDSDSILSLAYLPSSLTVLGAGVIASEYASVFAELGVEVTMVDRGPRPVGFLDPDLCEAFRASFEAGNGRYLPERRIEEVRFDGISQVTTRLDDGTELHSEKMLVALGRIGCLAELDLSAAGLEANNRGVLEVDAHGRTSVPHIYAVGDVAGPPALATAAMEQGRRAARHALGLDAGRFGELVPVGIYTLPEMASVGLSEPEAAEQQEVLVGRARFDEVARGQISGIEHGLLKLVVAADGGRVLGVHIVGEGATELVHVGQMAILAGARAEDLVENVFNFPTLAEAYRIAALDICNHDIERKATD